MLRAFRTFVEILEGEWNFSCFFFRGFHYFIRGTPSLKTTSRLAVAGLVKHLRIANWFRDIHLMNG